VKRAVIILSILAVIIVGGLFARSKLSAASPADKTQFKVAKVEVGTVRKTVSATGTLQPWTTVDIKSKAGGRVDAMLVDVGTAVTKGQKICLIDPSDTQLAYDQARADIDSAQARIQSSTLTVSLQEKQSELAVKTAETALKSAQAAYNAAVARVNTSKEQAEAQPKLTKASQESSKANLENTEKQLAEMKEATHPQERASAESALNQAKANLKNAEANLKRQESLMERGFVSKQVVDNAETQRDVVQAQVASAQRKLDTLDKEQAASIAAMEARVAQARAQYANAMAAQVDVRIRESSLKEAKASLEQANQQVKTAEKNLQLAKANLANVPIRRTDIMSANATKARAQAGLINAQKTLEQTTVTAPTDGVVLKKYVEQGTIISSALSFAATGNNIVQLGDTTRMFVDVTVDETDIANVDQGQAVDVTVEAYSSTPIEGKVIRIDPQAEVIQNVTMIHVRVEVDNTAGVYQLLKPGMNATCEFVIDKKEDVVSVPTEAVHTTDTEKYVEIGTGGAPYRGEDGKQEPDPTTLTDVKVIKRPVQTGLEGNDSIEITSGLKDGETVVTQKIEPTPKTATSPFAPGGGRGMGGFGGRGGGSGGGGRGGGGR
jgi:HlyD family secretion protein